MGKNTPSGKGTGGFKSAKTRRATKHAVMIKRANRLKNAAAKGQ
jgi:hypothetical protein